MTKSLTNIYFSPPNSGIVSFTSTMEKKAIVYFTLVTIAKEGIQNDFSTLDKCCWESRKGLFANH